MADPIYPVDVETALMELSGRLEEEVEVFAEVSLQRAEAESEYKRQYHRIIVRMTDGTVTQKESMAQVKSAVAFREWKIAEALEKSTQQKLMAIRTQIESLRTISANVRAAAGG
jgi:hypothetical protein